MKILSSSTGDQVFAKETNSVVRGGGKPRGVFNKDESKRVSNRRLMSDD